MNPSYCRACNPGCLCTGPYNQCESCIDDTYYWHPTENRCYKCDASCAQTEDPEASQTHRINCCSKCVWDTILLKPRCTQCKTSATVTPSTGSSYSVQVVSVADYFYTSQSSSYQMCYRCDRPTRHFGGNNGLGA
jgi:hypothetical protein